MPSNSRQIVLRSTTTRPADVTAYAAGDEISNSATAGSVVRMTYDLTGFRSGRVLATEIDLSAASGNVVTTASDFELLLFKTANVPAAVGDNVTHPIAAATRVLGLSSFRFDDTGWTGPLGTVAAGTSQIQKVGAHVVQPLATNVPQYPWPVGHAFEFKQGEVQTLTAVLRALAAWTPGAVVNTFGVTLHLEVEQ